MPAVRERVREEEEEKGEGAHSLVGEPIHLAVSLGPATGKRRISKRGPALDERAQKDPSDCRPLLSSRQTNYPSCIPNTRNPSRRVNRVYPCSRDPPARDSRRTRDREKSAAKRAREPGEDTWAVT